MFFSWAGSQRHNCECYGKKLHTFLLFKIIISNAQISFPPQSFDSTEIAVETQGSAKLLKESTESCCQCWCPSGGSLSSYRSYMCTGIFLIASEIHGESLVLEQPKITIWSISHTETWTSLTCVFLKSSENNEIFTEEMSSKSRK